LALVAGRWFQVSLLRPPGYAGQAGVVKRFRVQRFRVQGSRNKAWCIGFKAFRMGKESIAEYVLCGGGGKFYA
jgi:hypothetical protein